MTNIKKRGLVVIAAVVVVSIFVYYRSAQNALQTVRNEDSAIAPEVATAQRTEEELSAGSKKVTTRASYEVPGEVTDVTDFTVIVDGQGFIASISAQAIEHGSQEKLDEFSQSLITVIQGRKLNELGPVDTIGKSSLTTKAFNDSLDELKAQL